LFQTHTFRNSGSHQFVEPIISGCNIPNDHFVQLTNKAVSGDIKALREVIRLREKLQEKGTVSEQWSELYSQFHQS
jgi:hypothetical protein